MNYEQQKHKINNLIQRNESLSNKLDNIKYNAKDLNRENFIKKIIYLETDWITNSY
jgi:hypothetical protein